MSTAAQHVFGYGSLLERRPGQDNGVGPVGARSATLAGYRRTWNVAMDNTETIPGYKYYVDAATGVRGEWFVTFLNVVPDRRATVNGILFPVTDELLADLDRRERNYERVDVSGLISPGVVGRAWVYSGSPAALHRFERGLSSGRAVIARDYYERVVGDFAAVGEGALRCFVEQTDAPTCPVSDLRRVDVRPVLTTEPAETPGAGAQPAL